MAVIKPPNAPWPSVWLLSDARNDAGLERALKALPRGSGFIYRHYHLDGPERLAIMQHMVRILVAYMPYKMLLHRIASVIEIAGGAPVVIKLLEGTQGIGVVLGETHQSAKSMIEAFRGAGLVPQPR